MSATENTTNVSIELFDPPMCCPGGMCGPAIDPALLDISEAVLKMKNQHGVIVQRYLLQQNGDKFMQNPGVKNLLQEHGTDILPVTAVNGEVVKTGAFPSYEELAEWAGVTEAV